MRLLWIEIAVITLFGFFSSTPLPREGFQEPSQKEDASPLHLRSVIWTDHSKT